VGICLLPHSRKLFGRFLFSGKMVKAQPMLTPLFPLEVGGHRFSHNAG
jgi:hypothetical protein